MKRTISFIMIIVLMLSMCVFSGFAADGTQSFFYELSIDGKDTVEVKKGDKITITLHLNRTDSDEPYNMYAMQDEIRYDSRFFKLVEGSANLHSGISSTDISVQGGMREFYMNHVSMAGGKKWEPRTRIGSFQLEVIAESGVSTISNEDYLVSLPDGSASYPCRANELTVIVSSDCTVSFATNGGSAIKQVSVFYGEKLSRPADPVREGKQFVGWYTDIHLKNAWDFDKDTVKGNMTLYAKWKDAPVVTPTPPPVVTPTPPPVVTPTPPPVVTPTPPPVVTPTPPPVVTPTPPPSQPPIDPPDKYRLEFDLNGGSFEPGVNPGGLYSEGTVVGLPVPVREGYAFMRWYNGDTPTEIYNAITVTEDTTLTAEWTIIEYTITFNTAGGEPIEPATYTIESDYELPTPIREGYGFMGWQIDRKDEYWPDEVYGAGTSVLGRQGDIELTALWEYGFFCEVEDYRYAPEDYVLLRIAADDNTNGYSIDGEPLFYTDDVNYRIDGKGVYLTLVSTKSGFAGGFSQEIMAKLTRTGVPGETIVRDGDVNGDGEVNREDANIVYLMVRRGGGSYSLEQLSIAQRLAADVNTATKPGDNLYRGSLADVNAIVNLSKGAK